MKGNGKGRVSEVSQLSRAVANANGARWYSLKETSGSAKQVNPTRSINFRDRYIYGGLSNSDADDISQIAECLERTLKKRLEGRLEQFF